MGEVSLAVQIIKEINERLGIVSKDSALQLSLGTDDKDGLDNWNVNDFVTSVVGRGRKTGKQYFSFYDL